MTKQRLWVHVLVIGLFLVLTSLMTYPLVLGLRDSVQNYGDPLLNAWMLAWENHQLLRNPFDLFNANIFYPNENSLAYTENMFAAALMAMPIWLATKNAILGLNFVTFLSFILSGYGMYLLVEYYTRSRTAGIVAGIIFAFFPYRINQFGHLQIMTTHWVPFIFLYLQKYLDMRRGVYLFPFGLFFVLQVLSSFNMGFYVSLALGLFIIIYLLLERAHLFRLLPRLLLTFFVSFLAILPFAIPYLVIHSQFGLERDITELNIYSADILDYLRVPDANLLYAGIFKSAFGLEEKVEHVLFPGIVPTLLALLGFLAYKKRASRDDSQEGKRGESRVAKLAHLSIFLFSFLMTFGPELVWSGKPTGMILPYRFFFDYLPFLRSVRVPTRFAPILMFSLAVLAGWGFVFLVARLKALTRKTVLTSSIMFLLIAGVITLEYISIPLTLQPIPVGDKIPGVYKWLAEQEGEKIIIELPDVIAENYEEAMRLGPYQYYSTYHWSRLVNGNSSFVPPTTLAINDVMEGFPSQESISLLKELKVDYIILHSDFYGDGWQSIKSGIDLSPNLSLVGRFGEDLVYSIK